MLVPSRTEDSGKEEKTRYMVVYEGYSGDSMMKLHGLRLDPYIIAEVGQNHQGSIEEALRYVSVFGSIGASAVKFQIRTNRKLFDRSVYDMPYENENSFGATYGEHRESLELSFEEYKSISRMCRELDVDFMVTPFDEEALEVCIRLDVDVLKLASFDLGNLPFIKKVSQVKKPTVMSTGGGTFEQIRRSVETFCESNPDLSLLHCVSKYPCPAQEMQLSKILELKEMFPHVRIGISDHFNGILSGPISYMLGASVFEKHVTFDRSQKGTDHKFSLEPDGFRRFIRDINRVEKMLPVCESKDLGSEPVFKKLGKSIIITKEMKAGEEITMDCLSGKICRPGVLAVRDAGLILGRKLKRPMSANSYINLDDVIEDD